MLKTFEFMYTSAPILTLNCINCRVEKKTKAYTFAAFVYCKNLFASNILVFEDLNKI